MRELKSFITNLHTRTKRNYIERMVNEKVLCMKEAKKYDYNFWDGDRKFGYGGYKYDGRWKTVAEQLIDGYSLSEDAKILDVGCGKGYLLHELKNILPGAEVTGLDLSEYAIANAKEEIQDRLIYQRAQDAYPFQADQFDLVISLTTLHNLYIYELSEALREIERVGKNKYIVVESYKNEEELFNLQCWALTCETFLNPREWVWLFDQSGYTGDYEFIYFE